MKSTSGSEHRWKVLIMSFIGYLYDSLDLAILAIAMPVIIKSLNISLADAGLLSSATMIGAALGSILFGWLAENWGRKKTAVLSLVSFGFFTAMVFFVTSWGQFMVVRLIAGIGIGGIWGPLAALVAEHWTPQYRARAESFMLSTFALGSAFAALLGYLMLGKTDWRYIFVIGGTAMIAGLFFAKIVPASQQQQSSKEKVSISELFRGKTLKITLLAILASAAQMGGYWGVNAWIPTFLVKERGLSLSYMGMFSLVIYLGAFFGYMLYAYMADKIGRKKSLIIAFIADSIIVPMYVLIPNPYFLFWFGPVMGLSFGGVFGLFGSYFTELFPERIRALGGGMAFNIGRLGAVIAPYTVGVLAKQNGLAFGIGTASAIFFMGAIVLLFLPETYGSKATHHAGVSETQ